tara:strand:+ start:504 stop:806 length:303 start_codon:yes stop_codon:yes gene_type:complete
MVESALMGYNFNKVATPVVAGMSDISFMLVVGSILTIFFPNIVIPTGVDQVDEIIKAIITGIKQAREEGFGDLEFGLGPIDTPRSLAKLLYELIGRDAPE